MFLEALTSPTWWCLCGLCTAVRDEAPGRWLQSWKFKGARVTLSYSITTKYTGEAMDITSTSVTVWCFTSPHEGIWGDTCSLIFVLKLEFKAQWFHRFYASQLDLVGFERTLHFLSKRLLQLSQWCLEELCEILKHILLCFVPQCGQLVNIIYPHLHKCAGSVGTVDDWSSPD